jgi:hypothetical protein
MNEALDERCGALEGAGGARAGCRQVGVAALAQISFADAAALAFGR